MYKLPEEPQKILHTFKSGFYLWKENLHKILPLTIVCVLINSIPIFLVPAFNTYIVGQKLKFLIDNWMLALLFYLFAVYAFTAIFYHVHLFATKQTSSVTRNSLLETLRRFPLALATALLYGFIVSIGLFFFLFPGFILMVFLFMSLPIAIMEQKNPLGSIRESWHLVKNKWWHTLALLVMILAVYYILNVIIYMHAPTFGNFVHPLGDGRLWLVHNILQAVLAIIFYPFICSEFYALWHDYKLMAKMQEFSEDVATKAD